MSSNKAVEWDVADAETLRLLKSDPVKYFQQTRRQPFGFAVPDSTDRSVRGEDAQ